MTPIGLPRWVAAYLVVGAVVQFLGVVGRLCYEAWEVWAFMAYERELERERERAAGKPSALGSAFGEDKGRGGE